jgi:hypothetical protein
MSRVENSPEEGPPDSKCFQLNSKVENLLVQHDHEQDKNIWKLPLCGPIGALGLDSAHA